MGGKQDIGGYDIQKQEIHESVELPLTHHELYKQIGMARPPTPPQEFCCMDLQELAKPCLPRLLLIQLLLSFV
jgi:SpoVK/Ycf46/Vps4 family AAA+-type ATPase